MSYRYQPVWDAVGDPLVVVDDSQAIVVFNDAAVEAFGYQVDEVLGQPLAVLLPARFHRQHRDLVDGFLAGGPGRHLAAMGRSRVVARRKDGTEFPVDVTLKTLLLEGDLVSAATVRDVTDRVAAETALARSEARFRVAFEESPVAIALVDLEGNLIAGNTALSEISGYSIDELSGMPMGQLVEPDDMARVADLFGPLLAGEAQKARVEVRQRRADDTIVHVDLSFAVVHAEGTPGYVIGQALDVTERVRSAERLEEALRSKDDLIASISHEIRTPLTALVGFSQILHDEAGSLSEEERSQMLDSVISESTDLTNLVDDLLVAAKAEVGALEVLHVAVGLREMTDQVLGSWPGDAMKGLAVTGSAEVIGDPARIRQVIRNLLANALRYGGSDVSVHIEGMGTEGTLDVVDDGEAIVAGDRERIFEAYERAHDAVGLTASMGLGLTISRQLARLMGGDVIYLRDGDRNVFRLVLPGV